MTAFSFHATFNTDENTLQNIIIHFDYFLPATFTQWQDKQHGSIQIIEIMNADTIAPLPHQSTDELIRIRQLCWEYLETHQLFKQHNIVPLFG